MFLPSTDTMKMWSLLLLLMVKGVWLVTAAQPMVTIGQSTIHGSTVQVDNIPVEQYLGLRYAQSPVGSLRFSKPVAATLPSVVNATTYPSTCPSMFALLPEHEDCLFLSLYVRQSSRQRGAGSSPVMVWFHGGGFVFGSGSQYDGAVLAAQGNVIVVTPNYRLGALGFLSTGDNSSMGNFGLWDQWLALTWVRDNIGHFGGDASRVTIFGESAGSASVSFHMTSPHSRGLFHRAILQSGTRLCPWATVKDPLSQARVLGKRLSCANIDSTTALVSCLRGKPWKNVKPTLLFADEWAPVVDGDFVLPFNQSATFDGPYMIGYNNREGGFLLPVYKATHPNFSNRTAHLIYVQQIIDTVFPSLAATATPSEKTQAAKIVDCMYRREESTDSYVPETELEAFVGDTDISVCSQQFINAERTNGEVFLYYFNHYPDNIKNGDKGMDHAMDIDYTFGFVRGVRARYSPFFNHTLSERDRRLGLHFRALLTNFAHSGKPNQPATVPGWPTWLPYTKEKQSYLVVTSPPQVLSHLNEDTMTVWLKTVPGELRSLGPLGLNETRWAYCPGRKTSSCSKNSASVFLVVVACLWVAFAMFV